MWCEAVELEKAANLRAILAHLGLGQKHPRPACNIFGAILGHPEALLGHAGAVLAETGFVYEPSEGLTEDQLQDCLVPALGPSCVQLGLGAPEAQR